MRKLWLYNFRVDFFKVCTTYFTCKPIISFSLIDISSLSSGYDRDNSINIKLYLFSVDS